MLPVPNQSTAKGISLEDASKLSQSSHWFFAHQKDARITSLINTPTIFNNPTPGANTNG